MKASGEKRLTKNCWWEWRKNADSAFGEQPNDKKKFFPLLFFSFCNGREWEQVKHLPESLCEVAAWPWPGSVPGWDTVGRVWCWSWAVSAVTRFQLCSIPTGSSTWCLAAGTGHPPWSSPALKQSRVRAGRTFPGRVTQKGFAIRAPSCECALWLRKI